MCLGFHKEGLERLLKIVLNLGRQERLGVYEQLRNLAKSFVQALPRLGAWLFVFCLFFVNHFWAVLLGLLAIYCTVFLAIATWTVAIELYSKHAASIFREASAIR